MSDPRNLSDAELLSALKAPQPSGVAAMSDDDLRKALNLPAPVASPPSVAADVAKSAGSGVARGITGLLGGIGDAANFVGNIADWGAEKITGQKVPDAVRKNAVADAIGSESINRFVDSTTGLPVTSYKPETTAGKYAKTAAEFVPGAMLGPGGVAKKAIGFGILPGLASEAAGQATEGTAAEPYARLTASIAGTALPGLARRIASPLPIPPERQALVNALTAEGVPLTAGQQTGNKGLQYAESILGDAPFSGGAAQRTMAAQGEAFTDAAMRRAGGSGRATPENMTAMRDRIGGEFDRLANSNTLRADPQLGTDINTALQQYGRKLPSEQRALVGNEAVEIIQRLQANGGTLAGREYQVIRSDLSRRAHAATDPEYGRALAGLRDALDGAMARSISPEDAAAWATANREYGNMRTLENAVGGAGADTAAGLISPAMLRSAAAQRNKGAYVRGEGDFGPLARGGVGVMSPLPNSGTAQRQMVAGGAGGGALTAAATGNFPLAAALAFGPGVAGRVLHSRPIQGYLANQKFAAPTPAVDQVLQALLAARSASLPAIP